LENDANCCNDFETFSRKDITGVLEKNLKIDTLLLAGTKGSYGHTVQTLHTMMDKQKTQLLKIDDVGDVVNEAVSFQFSLIFFSNKNKKL